MRTQSDSTWHVYIIRCNNDALYTGVTTDLERRFNEHATARGAKYTRANGAKKLVYSEVRASRSDACRREAEIKSWRREQKLELIKQARKKY